MRQHLDGGPIAGRHAHVAARILNLDGGVGGNLLAQRWQVEAVLGQAKGVEEIVIQTEFDPLFGKPGLGVIPFGGVD
jgi:hypothetical protein